MCPLLVQSLGAIAARRRMDGIDMNHGKEGREGGGERKGKGKKSAWLAHLHTLRITNDQMALVYTTIRRMGWKQCRKWQQGWVLIFQIARLVTPSLLHHHPTTPQPNFRGVPSSLVWSSSATESYIRSRCGVGREMSLLREVWISHGGLFYYYSIIII